MTTSAIARDQRLRNPAPRHNIPTRVRSHGRARTVRRVSYKLLSHQIEKVSPCPVLGLHDPRIRIEPEFFDKTRFHGLFRQWLLRYRDEKTLDRPAVVIDGLRRRHEQHGIAIEQRHLDEHGTSFIRAAPTYGAKDAGGLAAAQISRHPYTRFSL